MAKIADEELDALQERCLDLVADLRNLEGRFVKDIGADIRDLASRARIIGGLASAASSLTHKMLIPLAIEDDRKRIEAEMRARQAATPEPENKS